MHEDNQFGHYGRVLLWISDHILHRALLSLPSSSSGYRIRRRRNREEGINNNWFYYGTTHDVYIDLLCASASSIRQTSYNNRPNSTVSLGSFLLKQSTSYNNCPNSAVSFGSFLFKQSRTLSIYSNRLEVDYNKERIIILSIESNITTLKVEK